MGVVGERWGEGRRCSMGGVVISVAVASTGVEQGQKLMWRAGPQRRSEKTEQVWTTDVPGWRFTLHTIWSVILVV